MHRVLFQIGSFSVYSYGVCIALAFLICTLLIRRDCIRDEIPFDKVLDCFLWVLIGGIVGGRLLFVCTTYKYFLQFPLKIFAIRDGGMAFQGSLIAGVVVGAIACWRKKISFAQSADLIAPYIALGQAIGRVGCFLNGCCYGKVARSGFGVMFPGDVCMRIPVQAYTAIGLLCIYLVLLRVRDSKLFKGSTILMYMIIYSGFRFFIEFFRGDNLSLICGIRLPQIISVIVFIISVICFMIFLGKKRLKNDRTEI